MDEQKQTNEESQAQTSNAEQATEKATSQTEVNPYTVAIDTSHDVTDVFAREYLTIGGAHSNYIIRNKEGVALVSINFQDGAIKEVGSNGVMNEDLLAIVIDRLSGFQSGPYACEENRMALIKVQAALTFLKDRTLDRKKRGVQSSYQK